MTTNHALSIADRLAQRGFALTSVEVHTLDGRRWMIDATSMGGYRLFEMLEPENEENTMRSRERPGPRAT